MNRLKELSLEIRDILEKKRKETQLTFIEDSHTYYMLNNNGELTTKWPSVSKIIKNFHEPFDANAKALQMAKGDVNEQKRLLSEWKLAGDLSTNMGSRVHYELEKYLIEKYDNYKEVRKPIFENDSERIIKSDLMINAGKDFLQLMEERGAVLLDTEIVLGDKDEGYVGQADNSWLMYNKEKTDIGIVITDYKSNQPKNFIPQWYNKYLYPPFNDYRDYALTHYYLQIPLYGRLLLKMLKDTKFSNLDFYGGVVVLLKDNGEYVEYRIPKDIKDKILSINIKKFLK